jgi:hypothetical protein
VHGKEQVGEPNKQLVHSRDAAYQRCQPYGVAVHAQCGGTSWAIAAMCLYHESAAVDRRAEQVPLSCKQKPHASEDEVHVWLHWLT